MQIPLKIIAKFPLKFSFALKNDVEGDDQEKLVPIVYADEDKITFTNDRAGHDKKYSIDAKKAKEELGFKRNYNFEEGLINTIKWYLDQYRGYS